MSEHLTQLHGSRSATAERASKRKSHWKLLAWSMVVWLIVTLTMVATENPVIASAVSIPGLASVLAAAWLLDISRSPLRRNLFALAYYCLTCAPGTGLLFFVLVVGELPFTDLSWLFFSFAWTIIPILPSLALASFLPLFIPVFGTFFLWIARNKLPEPALCNTNPRQPIREEI